MGDHIEYHTEGACCCSGCVLWIIAIALCIIAYFMWQQYKGTPTTPTTTQGVQNEAVQAE